MRHEGYTMYVCHVLMHVVQHRGGPGGYGGYDSECIMATPMRTALPTRHCSYSTVAFRDECCKAIKCGRQPQQQKPPAPDMKHEQQPDKQ
jgi:hypothetical protein